MDKKTLKITYGAALIAIFTVMLLLNRQTGGFFEEIFMFVFPIPMVAYAAMYGWKSSIPVLVGMIFFSFIFGTFYTIFYAASEGIIGLVFGTCLYKKVDATKTMASVIILSVIFNLLDTIVIAEFMGVSLQSQIQEMQDMMNKVFEQTGIVLPENMISNNFLLQMLVISMVFLGIMQGFIIYQMSLMILRRLRFQVQKPKSLFLCFPPKWTGYLAAAIFVVYNVIAVTPVKNELLQNTLQALGICGNLYLVCFGMVAMLLYARMRMPKLRGLMILLCMAGYLIVPWAEIVLGFFYVSMDLHEKLLYEPQKTDRPAPQKSGGRSFKHYVNKGE